VCSSQIAADCTLSKKERSFHLHLADRDHDAGTHRVR
jgi:hypothetical protein